MQTNEALKEETLILDRDLRKIPIFSVGPDSKEPRPALILIHEIFGVNQHIRDVARRFAKTGMRVFAPDLFAPASDYPSDPAKRDDLATMRNVWSGIPDSQLLTDLEGVFGLIASKADVIPTSIGAAGFCMGGAIAFMFGCNEPRLAWVIDFYGRIKYGALTATKSKHPIEYAFNLKCPMLGLFAGRDELITAEDRNSLAKILEANGKTFQLKVYEDAEHAFFNDVRPHYDEAAAKDAWERSLGFMSTHNRCAEAKSST